ncbi:uncharacterized protein LOC126803675 [Argentina anserina]|uniref:uncharacterized protein LOC126803675 n=1 Tax=Argentina anserina TaxID=57926 RepID=UPI00217664E0|nr:uncharacterized protein LOC126803675 [Potentilla anserina]
MDKRWMQYDRGNPEYQQGILDFLLFVLEHAEGRNVHKCPCVECHNTKWMTIYEIHEHLNTRRIMRSYTTWNMHGETLDHEPTMEEIRAGYFQHASSSRGSIGPHVDPSMDIVQDAFPSFASRHEDEVVYDTTDADHAFSHVHNGDYDKYNRLIAEAQTPLYRGCKETVLGAIIDQIKTKVSSKWSNVSFNRNLVNIRKLLPPENNLPHSFEKVQSILKDLGLGYETIDACKNNCVLFYGVDNQTLDNCPVCNASRWKTSKKRRVPVKILRYFPLIPRLKRLYMSSHTSKKMRWHGVKRTNDDILRHPADGEAWKSFDRCFPDFAADIRNVRLGLATDGFNPSGNMNLSYSIWPVIVVVYNLPPYMCMKKEFSLLTLLIPGRYSPGKCLDVYMRPLIDELKELWENGIPTFDKYSQTSFRMKAAVIWTISDFPGYGMLSSQTTHGYRACPICLEDINSSYHAGKRFDAASFDGKQEFGQKPRERSGEWILDMLNSFDLRRLSSDRSILARNPKRPSRLENWTHKSIFFELPYWKKLRIRHCLDVMHIEKNVCDSVVGTVFGFKDKTKDTLKARKDLQMMNIRPHLWLKQSGSGPTLKMPLAPYRVNPANEKKHFKWFEAIKYPHGYAGNISRCVKVGENKLIGLKTHDCHIMLQRLFPVVIRPYLRPDVVEPLVALSRFFQQLCARELKKSDVLELKEDIVYIMCKLERIFPPAFFDVMIHLMVHLPEQALLTGPVHYTWMFPQERYIARFKVCQFTFTYYCLHINTNSSIFRQLGEYKKYVRNRGKPEGSIANAYLLNECVTYGDLYRSNATEAESSRDSIPHQFNLSVVSDVVRLFGNLPNSYKLTTNELREAHWCVLDHCSEVEYYKNKHLAKIKARQPYGAEEMQKKTFPDYFLNWMEELQHENNTEYSQELHHLACKPQHHSVRGGCFVNGVKFVTFHRDEDRVTQNYGVMVEGDETCYYGVLLSVVELLYGAGMPVVLFKCKWFNTDPSLPRSTKMDHGFLSVNTATSWYEDAPFILATMARQVFYLDDPKEGGDWKVANVMSHRNIWSASILEGDDDRATDDEIEATEPYQEASTSHIPDTQTIRINNDPHYIHVNEFITIPTSDEDDEEGDEEEDEEPYYDEDEEDEEDDDIEDEDYV